MEHRMALAVLVLQTFGCWTGGMVWYGFILVLWFSNLGIFEKMKEWTYYVLYLLSYVKSVSWNFWSFKILLSVFIIDMSIEEAAGFKSFF